ncbi:MAG: ABC transporter ATP-binding protein [Candidatus Delongbacteria bacterium]|nr:ABC transporter ATP-binding protein [Candidatus Delongbacteria bacterium]MBN2835446.1 ABC transporter ATP-binding protein [Candidatus Delongbacteria bacterium]
MKVYINWFWQFWKKEKGHMIGVFLATVITMSIKTGFPLLLKFIIDEMSTDFQPSSVYNLIYIFIIVAIVHEFAVHALPFYRGTLNIIFAAMIRNKYYTIFTENNHSFFKKFRTGDLLTRLTDDVDGNWDRIAWYSCSGILRPVEAILILGFSLSVMFTYSWELSLYSFIPIPFLVLILSKLEDKMVKYTDEKQKSVSACNNVLESCFSGIRVIKTTLSEDDQIKKYKHELENRVSREKDFLKINQLIHFFSMFVNHSGKIIVIFVGSYFVVSEKITIGTLLLFIIYLERMIEPIWTLGYFYASSKQVFRYVDRIIETEKSEKFEFKNDGVKFDRFKKLKVENLGFTFEDGINGVKDINFTLNKGETLAVVGSIGSGKTTLLELLSGNITPGTGRIVVNGVNLQEINHESFAKITGYVKQENLLFSDKIVNNLTLGDSFDENEIFEALENSLVDKEIDKFPNKLETVLGQRGVSVSGGQKQRLSLARALIRKPGLLLMDDVTAAMDAKTETLFWEKFNQKFPDTACIIVTHRMVTARQADKIIVLDEGRMVESGTHDQLFELENSLYRTIMSS